MDGMVNVTNLDALYEHGIRRAVIAIGVFDGVHLGHQKLIGELLEMGKAHDAVPVALTFHPHPRSVLKLPHPPPPLLFPREKKVALLGRYGVRAVVTIPFTLDFAALEPGEFIRDTLIAGRVELKGICVGREWRFGYQGRGTVGDLEGFAAAGHFDFRAVEELTLEGQPVSSTAIRRAIAAGRLEEAAAMLGRPYSISGVVGHGFHVATERLDCPTANILFESGVLPPFGVYAVSARVDGRDIPGAANIGYSPTFKYQSIPAPRIEAHLFDFSDNLYGRELELELLKYIREERDFSSPEALKAQIDNDIKQIRVFFASRNGV